MNMKENKVHLNRKLVEVGNRRFVAISTTKPLKEIGICDKELRHATKAMSDIAARRSQWLWQKRSI